MKIIWHLIMELGLTDFVKSILKYKTEKKSKTLITSKTILMW